MAGVGSFLGLSRDDAKDGGIFNLKEQRLLKLNNKWSSEIDIVNTGLQLYLDANNTTSYPETGSTWFDLSGNNRNFTWASSPSFNSSGIKYFNTLNNAANGPASNSFNVTNTSGYTIFMTILQNSLVSTGAFKWYGTGTNTRGIFSHCTWSDGSIYWDQGGCCASDTRTKVALSSSTGTWHVIAFRNNYSATNRTIWRNNQILTTNTSSIANLNLNTTAAQVGSSNEYGGNSSTWNARIGQFALYNRSLSDAEMTSVYNTLRVKVGL